MPDDIRSTIAEGGHERSETATAPSTKSAAERAEISCEEAESNCRQPDVAACDQADPADESNYLLLKELLSKSKFLTAFMAERINAPPKKKKSQPKRRKVTRANPTPAAAAATAATEAVGDGDGDDDNIDQPVLLTGGKLRPYQKEGFRWLKVLFKNGINGILGDEMGLGKTIQIIALIAHLIHKNVPGHFLICAPLSTLTNWIAEFKRFAPAIPVLLYHGTITERSALRHNFKIREEFDVGRSCLPIVVTSYEIVIKDYHSLSNFDWTYLIIDEGQRIKNFNSKLFSCLTALSSANRLLLTGTPLQNNLAELWSLLHFLMPELFDQLKIFNSWFDISSLNEDGSDERIIKQEEEKHLLSTFHEIVSPFMLRRLKCDVATHVPPKREFHVKAPLMPQQDKLYKAILNKTINALMGQVPKKFRDSLVDVAVRPDAVGDRPKRFCTMKRDDDVDTRRQADIKLRAAAADDNDDDWANKYREVNVKTGNPLMALRKACNHPYQIEYPIDPTTNGYLFDENLVNCSGKMIVLDKMLDLLKRNGHKVLIFSQMTTMLDIIQDFCYLRRYAFCRLDGSMGLEERNVEINRFNNDDEGSFIFLISTRAGGLGLNLTAADTVIIYDSDWNPQCDRQAMARCHRIGQTRPVVIVRFVTENSVEEKMVQTAAAKSKLEKLVIHKDLFKKAGRGSQPFDKKELLEMLTSSDCSGVVHSGRDQLFAAGELERIFDRNFGNKEPDGTRIDAENVGRVVMIEDNDVMTSYS